jgi:hypothetical protein
VAAADAALRNVRSFRRMPLSGGNSPTLRPSGAGGGMPMQPSPPGGNFYVRDH